MRLIRIHDEITSTVAAPTLVGDGILRPTGLRGEDGKLKVKLDGTSGTWTTLLQLWGLASEEGFYEAADTDFSTKVADQWELMAETQLFTATAATVWSVPLQHLTGVERFYVAVPTITGTGTKVSAWLGLTSGRGIAPGR